VNDTDTRSATQCSTVLIIGGAGFIGTNLAERLLTKGVAVRVLDSLARPGSQYNIAWLAERHQSNFQFIHGDVRQPHLVQSVLRGVDHVYHLAAQVAVTSSIVDPQLDFAVNAQGTLNVLQAARQCRNPPSVLYSSTNKVYGALADLALVPAGSRYVPADPLVRAAGISEARNLEFHSPYGCSKGAAEQYVLDYSRTYGLRTVVLRMSCIYGPHQHGNEDQGWVAHFLRRAMADERVTIYGDGLQVRDLLFVDDLIDAFELARCNVDSLSGRAFNMGGGVANAVSVLEVLEQIEQVTEQSVQRDFGRWRSGDQRYYVSDTTRFHDATGWQARIGVAQGLRELYRWLQKQPALVPLAGGAASRRRRGPELRP
jgi:CDP-paratose 2-epimerase